MPGGGAKAGRTNLALHRTGLETLWQQILALQDERQREEQRSQDSGRRVVVFAGTAAAHWPLYQIIAVWVISITHRAQLVL